MRAKNLFYNLSKSWICIRSLSEFGLTPNRGAAQYHPKSRDLDQIQFVSYEDENFDAREPNALEEARAILSKTHTRFLNFMRQNIIFY